MDESMYMLRPYDYKRQLSIIWSHLSSQRYVERFSPLAPDVKHLLGISTASVTE
jgi:hypothetical protein